MRRDPTLSCTAYLAQQVKADLEVVGDLGEIAQQSRGQQSQLQSFFKAKEPQPLTVREILQVLADCADTSLHPCTCCSVTSFLCKQRLPVT